MHAVQSLFFLHWLSFVARGSMKSGYATMSQCSSTGTVLPHWTCSSNNSLHYRVSNAYGPWVRLPHHHKCENRHWPKFTYAAAYPIPVLRELVKWVCFLMGLDDHDQFACHCTLRLEKIVPRGMSWHRYLFPSIRPWCKHKKTFCCTIYCV